MEDARGRGFKKDSVINARWLKTDCRPIDGLYEYYEHNNSLFLGCVCIFDGKVWAEIKK